MCYGPEVRTVFECINRGYASSTTELKTILQYKDEGDISSLVDSVITFLKDLDLIDQKEKKITSLVAEWNVIQVFKKINQISKRSDSESLNYIFTNLFDHLFVKPNRMFVSNLHYHVISSFSKTIVGHEKINAWKRIMEYMGLGRRVYSGFYGLPQLNLMKDIVCSEPSWEGSLHHFCETVINPIIPCITNEDKVYNGILFSLVALSEVGCISISHKQDLPFKSYGPNLEWNWINVGGEKSASLLN